LLNIVFRHEDPYRFLYFNHMNLALKTSLDIKTAPLSMATIRLIRSIHADFAEYEYSSSFLGAHLPCARSAFRSKASRSTATEVCARTAENGWVVGRRAAQSHREFFVLVDDKVGSLSDIQGSCCSCICYF
jgi:hypothetical protein